MSSRFSCSSLVSSLSVTRAPYPGSPGRTLGARCAIASSEAGFSTVERSPGSSPVATARIGTAHDLGAARLRQLGDEHDPGRRERPPEVLCHDVSQRRLRARVVGRAGLQHDEAPDRLALHGVGHADRRRLGDRRDATPSAASTSAGPSRLPATLSVSSERPSRNQAAVLVDARPVAVHPHPREPAPVGVEVALVVAPDAPRHRGPRLAAHQLTHLARRRPASRPAPHTSTSMPSAGPPTLHSVIGTTGMRRDEACAHLGAARQVDDRAATLRDARRYHRYGSGFHGSPVEARMRSDDRSCARTGSVPCGIERPDQRGRDPERGDAVPLHHGPQPIGAGMGRRSLGEQHRRTRAPARRRSPTGP